MRSWSTSWPAATPTPSGCSARKRGLGLRFRARRLALAGLVALVVGCGAGDEPVPLPVAIDLSSLSHHPGVRRAATWARRGAPRKAAASLAEEPQLVANGAADLLGGLHFAAEGFDRSADPRTVPCTGLEAPTAIALARHLGLEDWRLLALARCLRPVDPTTSVAALESLLEEYGDSPLSAPASLELLELTLAAPVLADDHRQRLARTRRIFAARGATPEQQRRLAELAWHHAVRVDRPGLRRAAARRLLRDDPGSDLEAEILDHGSDPLPAWFGPRERQERARRALEAGRPDLARHALEPLDPVQIEAELWSSLLVAEGRPLEALHYLDAAGASAFELSCSRAEAARHAASTRRGRRTLPRAQRVELHRRSREELARCARQQTEEEAVRSWRLLLVQATRAEDPEATAQALHHLPAHDPAVLDHHWLAGWARHRDRDYPGALAAWDPLVESDDRSWRHRAARYWSADALAEIGHTASASELRQRLAQESPVRDFYRHHLPAELVTERPEPLPPLAWPVHPSLDRASALIDLGLEPLATLEIRQLATQPWSEAAAQERFEPAAAVLEARILSLKNQPRASIAPLLRAFPTLGTAAEDLTPARARQLYYPLEHLEEIRPWAEARGVELSLVLALIRQESAFDHQAVSRSGARGLMQLMTPTARELAGKEGVPFDARRLHEPAYNIRLASRYLRQVLDMFGGDVELALAGYNAGPYRIRRWWTEAGSQARVDRFVESLPMEEPRVYVKRILLLADSYERYHDLARAPKRRP